MHFRIYSRAKQKCPIKIINFGRFEALKIIYNCRIHKSPYTNHSSLFFFARAPSTNSIDSSIMIFKYITPQKGERRGKERYHNSGSIYLSSVARNSVCRNGSGMETGNTQARRGEYYTHRPIFRRACRWCRIFPGCTGCTCTRYVIRNTRVHPYTVCGGENTIEKSRHRRGGGLDRTVRRLQGYPASRAGDQQKLFYAEDHPRFILGDISRVSSKERNKKIEFSAKHMCISIIYSRLTHVCT